MTIATLDDIRTKIRRLTGSASDATLTDSRLDDYINSYYLYDLPAQFRSLQLSDTISFNTIKGISTYELNGAVFPTLTTTAGSNTRTFVDYITTISGPAYIAKKEVGFYQSVRDFFAAVPSDQYDQRLATGDGTDTYSGTTNSSPILPSINNNPAVSSYPAGRWQNILITANTSWGTTQNVTDIYSGSGNTGTLSGDGTGTINYETGAITVTFNSVVPSGEAIFVSYMAHTLARPIGILYYRNELTMWPPPDRGYTVDLQAYRQPTVVLASSDSATPELQEWWELIAAGAAKKVFEDRLDDDGIVLMEHMIGERMRVVEARTYAQLANQRVPTIFAGQTANEEGISNSFYWGY